MPKIVFVRRLDLAHVLLTSAAVAVSLLAIDEPRADSERGRLLYENHCMVCHESVVHVREDRKAVSREDLRAWVRRWQRQLDLQWEGSEVEDVTEFLNDRYYGFKSES